MEQESVIALIPARKGSKGLPRKNLVEVGGKPLITRAIEESILASVFDQIIVSSDDKDVAEIAYKHGVTYVERPKELVGDNISSDLVIASVIKVCQFQPDTVLVYLQPTSPLRTSCHIRDALKIFLDRHIDSVISVKSVASSWYKIMQLNDKGHIVGSVSLDAPFLNRQSVPKIYLPNGAIYIFRVSQFLENCNKIPRQNISPYIMSEIDSVDIDDAEDIAIAEQWL